MTNEFEPQCSQVWALITTWKTSKGNCVRSGFVGFLPFMQGTYALHKLSTEAEFRCQGDFLYQDDSQDINDHIPPADIRLL